MSAYVIVTIVAAAMALFSAGCGLFHASWVVKSLTAYGVPRSWWPRLSAAKIAGAVGLLAGLWITPLGIAAAICLTLYFVGAVITVVRSRHYREIPAPLVFLADGELLGPVLGRHVSSRRRRFRTVAQ